VVSGRDLAREVDDIKGVKHAGIRDNDNGGRVPRGVSRQCAGPGFEIVVSGEVIGATIGK